MRKRRLARRQIKSMREHNVEELQQFKCLTDLNEIIGKISSFKARPVERGAHPTIYEDRADGK